MGIAMRPSEKNVAPEELGEIQGNPGSILEALPLNLLEILSLILIRFLNLMVPERQLLLHPHVLFGACNSWPIGSRTVCNCITSTHVEHSHASKSVWRRVQKGDVSPQTL